MKKEEELETFNLTLPPQITLCRNLQKAGFAVPDTLSADELAEHIARALKEKNLALSPRTVGAGASLNEEESGRIECENLSYSYNPRSPFETQALFDVSLTVKSGEFFGIVGHTGSGKSTFVQHLNALIKLPTAEKKHKKEKGKTNEKIR